MCCFVGCSKAPHRIADDLHCCFTGACCCCGQGWDKFCFSGGIVEVSAALPGDAYTGGLWPAIWLLGELLYCIYCCSTSHISNML
jgi:Beta-glucan synthesis-associated protein SKN1/KRE6/Sbg1